MYYKTEVNSKLTFLDALLLTEGQNIITTVYIKVNWNSFCPQSWKRGTLKFLVQRTHLICSTEDLLKTEYIEYQI